MKLSTTLRLARNAGACTEGYRPVREYLGPDYSEDEPFPLLTILDHGRGMDDALWALRCILLGQEGFKRRLVSLFLADVLEHIQDRMLDPHSRAIIPLLREHAREPVSSKRWAAARVAAREAEVQASEAAAAAWVAARDEAWEAEEAAAAARGEAWEAESMWQSERLRYYLDQEE